VHHFLFRHVYFPSRSNFSQPVAMLITFLVSSLAHELVMSCITKKLRGYGFGAMMLQLPIVAVQKSRFFRGRTILNVSIPFVFTFVHVADFCDTECLFLVLHDSGSVYGMFLRFDTRLSSMEC
jgi:sterol O-acyltransferase